jgi:hypothetical protein
MNSRKRAQKSKENTIRWTRFQPGDGLAFRPQKAEISGNLPSGKRSSIAFKSAMNPFFFALFAFFRGYS